MKTNFKIKTSTLVFLGALFLTLVAFMVAPELGGVGAVSMASLIPVWGIVKEGTFKELSVDDIAKLSEEDQVKYFADKAENQNQEMAKKMKTMIEEAQKNNIGEKELKNQLDDLAKKQKESRESEIKAIKEHFEKITKTQGEALRKLTDNPNGAQKVTFSGAVKKALKDNHAKLSEWYKGNATGSGGFEIQIKAPGVTSTGNITPTDAAAVYAAQNVDGINAYQRGDIFLEQYLDVGTTQLASIPYVDEMPGEGDAAITSEGSLKPLIDTDYETKFSTARKIAGRMKATEEALYDFGWLESAMTNTLKKKHDIARQNDLIGNTNGLESIATDFNAAILGTVKVANPQYYDAIAALVAGIANDSEGYYVPNVVFVNTLDNLKKQLTKDENKNYVMPPFADGNGNIIDGVRVVARPSITAGNFIVGDFKNVKLRDLWGYTVRFGWENDDFSKNQITMIGESRYHLYATTNDKRGIIKGALADVITALTEVV